MGMIGIIYIPLKGGLTCLAISELRARPCTFCVVLHAVEAALQLPTSISTVGI